MADIRLQLFQCRFTHVHKGMRYNSTANIVAKCKEDAERLIHKLHKDIQYMSCNKAMEIHGIGDETSYLIAQANTERLIASNNLMNKDVKAQSNYYGEQFFNRYQALPDIQSVINTYKERT